MNASTTKKSFWVRNRLWILLSALIVSLPPLSFIFQFTQDSNFCGTWCPRMFFIWREGMTIGQYFAGWMRSYMGVLLVFGLLGVTLLWGRYWCSHICPIGGGMELGNKLVPKFLKINLKKIPAPSVRYGYLAVYIIAPIVGIGSLCCRYCNFATVPRAAGAAFTQADMTFFLRTGGLISLGLVLFLGVFAKGGRGFCNLICPIGALDAISNKLGAKFGKRMRVDATKCSSCGICEKVCPTWAVEVKDTAEISQISCMPCRICEDKCPKEAIHYGRS